MNKYGCQIINTWGIVKIIIMHMPSTQMHMHVKFEASIRNILGVIDMSVEKGKQMWLPDYHCLSYCPNYFYVY